VREMIPGRDNPFELPTVLIDLRPGKFDWSRYFRVREMGPGRDNPFELLFVSTPGKFDCSRYFPVRELGPGRDNPFELLFVSTPGKFDCSRYFRVRELGPGRDNPFELLFVSTPGKFGFQFDSAVADLVAELFSGKFDWRLPGKVDSSLVLLGGSEGGSRRLVSGWQWASERQSAIR